ncbi:MAG TPA: transposase [Gammaproteobacteria bacterium]
MPRRPRLYLPGVPCHVVQRGNNRAPCFFAPEDYGVYLTRLAEALERNHTALHAYVLMTNHVHLLLTPSDPLGISRVMQSVGRRYVQYVNWRYSRTGSLWEGRHKSSLVAAEDYLLRCHIYIEMNPVRAGMAVTPGDYAWSSFRSNALGEWNPIVTRHPSYAGLGADVAARQRAYRALFEYSLDSETLRTIRRAVKKSAAILPQGGEGVGVRIDSDP